MSPGFGPVEALGHLQAPAFQPVLLQGLTLPKKTSLNFQSFNIKHCAK